MMNMSISFQIRDSLTPEFKLFNCADAICTNYATLRCTITKPEKSVLL